MGVKITICVIAIGLLGVRFYWNNTTPVAAVGGSYTEGLVGSPRLINPLLTASSEADRDLTTLLFAGLLKINASGTLEPDLAEQYSVSEDQKEYTITLRDSLYWHDNEPLTLDDVIYTIETIQNPAFQSPLRSAFAGISLTTLDAKTLIIKLPAVSPSFPSTLTTGIVPKHIWYPIPTAQASLAEANIKPIGAGPYKFESLTKYTNGTVRQMNLTKHVRYHGGQPFIEKIIFKFYADSESAIDALKNKNVEGIGFLPVTYQAELEGTRGTTLHFLDLPQHRALFFNPEKNEALKEKSIRKALALSIDRERIVNEALGGNGKAVVSPVAPGLVSTMDDVASPYKPDEAIQLLNDARFTLSEESSVRKKDDTELTITITTIDQRENIDVATLIQEGWQDIGVATDIVLVDRQEIRKNTIEPRNYEVLLFGQITTSAEDIYAFWHSSQIRHPGNNLSVLANKDIDATLQELRGTANEADRNALFTTFSGKLNEEAFAIFLYTPTYIYPVSEKVRGMDDVQYIPLPSYRFSTISNWYIKTKRQWR